MNEDIILKILDQLDRICDTLKLHNEVLQMLLNDSIEKELESKGMFSDMDQQVQEFFEQLDCYRRKDD